MPGSGISELSHTKCPSENLRNSPPGQVISKRERFVFQETYIISQINSIMLSKRFDDTLLLFN